MEQFYLLSIIGNTLSGLVLAAEHLSKRISLFKAIDTLFKNIGVRVVLAFFVILIGLIKLVWPFNGIPIIGDLFPMAAGLGSGFTLLFDFVRSKSDVKSESLATLDKIFLNNKFLIGIGAMLISVLHFFLNGIVLF